MFFYPTKSLIFPKAPKLTIFKGLNIPNMEFEVYRAQARKFVSKMSDAPNVEEFEEIQATMDCWKANQKDLPALTSLAFKYAFLTGSSAAVERSVSYFHQILSEDRCRFDENTLEMLSFLYFNSGNLSFSIQSILFSVQSTVKNAILPRNSP